jgi:hypothetical protein
MSKILWMQEVQKAWFSYVNKMNRHMKPRNLESYLTQEIDMGMKLEEFAEVVFIEGFAAGEKYAKSCDMAGSRCQANLN